MVDVPVSPKTKTLTYIDYDLVLTCGEKISHTVRPDAGDVENIEPNGDLVLVIQRESEVGTTRAKVKFEVRVVKASVAVWSRCERIVTLPDEPFIPTSAKRINVGSK